MEYVAVYILGRRFYFITSFARLTELPQFRGVPAATEPLRFVALQLNTPSPLPQTSSTGNPFRPLWPPLVRTTSSRRIPRARSQTRGESSSRLLRAVSRSTALYYRMLVNYGYYSDRAEGMCISLQGGTG